MVAIVTEVDLLDRHVARLDGPSIRGSQLEFLDNRPLDGAGREKKLRDQHRKSGGKELF